MKVVIVEGRAKEAVKVETGLKTLEVVLQAPIAELRTRAWERLRKNGVLVPTGHPGVSNAVVFLREPYTVCWLTAEHWLGDEPIMVSAIGVAKRNPVDRRNLSVGATLAVYRAWRDFWVQAAQRDAGADVVRNKAGEPWGPLPEMIETLERVREAVAEVPF